MDNKWSAFTLFQGNGFNDLLSDAAHQKADLIHQ